LIELLIVISIIGTLASLILISFTGIQKSSRDTKRKSDLKQYQTALEQFANLNNGFFPSRGSVYASVTLCSDLGLSACPEDPRNVRDATFVYQYQSDGLGAGTTDATQYVLWGLLEKPSTSTHWVLCSNGKVGEATSGIPPTGGACPLL